MPVRDVFPVPTYIKTLKILFRGNRKILRDFLLYVIKNGQKRPLLSDEVYKVVYEKEIDGIRTLFNTGILARLFRIKTWIAFSIFKSWENGRKTNSICYEGIHGFILTIWIRAWRHMASWCPKNIYPRLRHLINSGTPKLKCLLVFLLAYEKTDSIDGFMINLETNSIKFRNLLGESSSITQR